jgi:hemerythrin-like domain-containing protein
MPEILKMLRQEHGQFARLLDVLDWHVTRLEQGDTADYDLIRAGLDYFIGVPDIAHHPNEDRLWAKLAARAPQETAAIGDLAEEHLLLARRTQDFAKALDAVFGDAIVPRDALIRWARGFIDLQRNHMILEERIFFPTAELKLTEADWADLAREVAAHPLSPAEVSALADFETLTRTILSWQGEFDGSAARARPAACNRDDAHAPQA